MKGYWEFHKIHVIVWLINIYVIFALHICDWQLIVTLFCRFGKRSGNTYYTPSMTSANSNHNIYRNDMPASIDDSTPLRQQFDSLSSLPNRPKETVTTPIFNTSSKRLWYIIETLVHKQITAYKNRYVSLNHLTSCFTS